MMLGLVKGFSDFLQVITTCNNNSSLASPAHASLGQEPNPLRVLCLRHCFLLLFSGSKIISHSSVCRFLTLLLPLLNCYYAWTLFIELRFNYDKRSVGKCLAVRLGLKTIFLYFYILLFDKWVFHKVVRPLWREDLYVIYSYKSDSLCSSEAKSWS
jgi:hypothetical protein